MEQLFRRWCQGKGIIFIVLLISSAVTAIVSASNCAHSGSCMSTFAKYNISVNGNCGEFEVQRGRSAELSCARQCLDSRNCSAFSYTSCRCTVCERQMIKGLMGKGEPIYFLREELLQGLSHGQIFISGPVTGRMVYFSFILKEYTRASMDFTTKAGDFALHINCRFNYLNVHNKVIFNSRLGGAWGTEVQLAIPSALAIGQKSAIYVAILPDKFQIWMADVFLMDYLHRTSVELLESVYVFGGVYIQELSI